MKTDNMVKKKSKENKIYGGGGGKSIIGWRKACKKGNLYIFTHDIKN